MDATSKTNQILPSFNVILGGNIPDPEAVLLIREYRDSIPRNKTKSVWLSRDVVAAILADIDATPDGDGVRIHFAKYLSKGYERVHTHRGTEENYNGRDTVMIIPTYTDFSGTSRDHISADEVKGIISKKEELISKIKENRVFDAFDNGTLCPPASGCAGSAFTEE
jgi:hypothetical protein